METLKRRPWPGGMRWRTLALGLLAVGLTAAEPMPVGAGSVSTPIPARPWAAIRNQSRHLEQPADLQLCQGTFTIPVQMEGYTDTTVYYSIPLGPGGAPVSTAQDIVLVFPWPGQRNAVTNHVLARRWGFTVISVYFDNRGFEYNEPKHYYRPESGSGNAWWRAVAGVRALAGLPDGRKVSGWGYSGGGSQAIQMAEAYPDRFDATIAESGMFFPEKPKFRGAVLLSCSEGEPVTADPTRRLLEAYRTIGTPVIGFAYHPKWGERGIRGMWAHNAEEKKRVLYWPWLAEVLALRDRSGGVVPAEPRLWFQRRGQPFPSRQLADIAAEVPAFSCDLPPRAPGRIHAARPVGDAPPRGTAVFLPRSAERYPEEWDLDTIHLSDAGVLGLVAYPGITQRKQVDGTVIGDVSVPGWRGAIAQVEHATRKEDRGPLWLIVERPNADDVAMVKAWRFLLTDGRTMAGVAVVGAKAEAAPFLKAVAEQGWPTVVVGTKAAKTELEPVLGAWVSSWFPTKGEPGPAAVGLVHHRRNEALMTWIREDLKAMGR